MPNAPFGVWGDAGSRGPTGFPGNGVVGSSLLGTAVAGFSLADDPRAAGVFGTGPRVGVAGYVQGAASAPSEKTAVYGSGLGLQDLNAVGVMGESFNNNGVRGTSILNDGVSGTSQGAAGVRGTSAKSVGVIGTSPTVGVAGLSVGLAGVFGGAVHVTGPLIKGGGGFAIDHPLDPAHKFLRHSFVESPDMKNVYDGIAVCDERGEAVVELPQWFEEVNEEFRYQLCPIGAPTPTLHIASEVSNNCFIIGGGAEGLRVSWQVTGIRRDPWARSNRIIPEEEKSGAMDGRYLHPELYGQSRERSIIHQLLGDVPPAEAEQEVVPAEPALAAL